MGCFLGCFGRKKNRRRQRRRESFQPRLNRISEGSIEENHLKLNVPKLEEVPKVTDGSAKDDLFKVITVKNPNIEEIPKISVIPTTDTCEKAKESYNPNPRCKRVTFDSNVKTYEHIEVKESISLEEKKKPLKSQCSFEGSDITSNSLESYPSNHRYQNCRESDDDDEEEEEEVTDCDESDLDDELVHEDYYYEDKLQNWDKEVYTEEIADNVKFSSVRDRSGYVNSVLNPIENLTQWKALKSKGRSITTKTQISLQEHNPKASSFSLETKKERTQEVVAVDASLSTWLTTSSGSSSVSTTNTKPVQSYDERPILCALTSEEIKQFSARNSPRKSSPSRSPDSPIIGTVGGYWNNQSMSMRKNRVV